MPAYALPAQVVWVQHGVYLLLQMLKISHFAVGKSLLLLSGGKDKLYAYIVQAGLIREQARAEFQYYVRNERLVCVTPWVRAHHRGPRHAYLCVQSFLLCLVCVATAECTLQVLVLDLDETLVHSTQIEPHNQHLLRSGPALAIHFNGEVEKLMVTPRAHLLQFFRHIMHRYHVFFCTTGIQSYAEAVLEAICVSLLSDDSLTSEEKKWIDDVVHKR